ncbi:MAG: hypothetical protein SFU86_11435 [Pirellulaceae bacterium]|nr:hypothetical protein [Pirellulaceae bacterium]
MSSKFKFEEPDFDAAAPADGVVEYQPADAAPTSAVEGVLRRHETRLLSLPGVKGVGIGSGPTGDDCIQVFVAHPGMVKGLPAKVEGICLTTTVVGEVDAYNARASRG